MSFGICARTMLLAACFGQLLSACAQDTPDHLDFALRTLIFQLSGDSPQWRQAPPGGVPDMVCAGEQALSTDCCTPPEPLSPIDCQKHPLICDPWDNFCRLAFDLEPSIDVNLSTDVPAIAALDGWVFSTVSLVAPTTSAEGVGSLPIRSAELYIGPKGLPSAASPDARLLGQVHLAPSGTPLSLSQDAQAIFSSFAREYKTPFALLLSAHLVLPSGPQSYGAVTVTLKASARAEY